MANAKGFKGQLRWAYESTYGVTPASPTGYVMPIMTSKITAKQSLDEDQTIRGRRDPAMPSRGQIDVSGPITFSVDEVSIGHFLKALCGAPTTTGTADPYTHVFKPSDTQPSLVLEQAYPDVNVYEVFNGCKIAKLGLTWGGSGVLQGSADVIGATQTVGTTSFVTSPSSIAVNKFFQSEGVIKEGGSTSSIITQATIDINTGLDADTHGNNGVRQDIFEGLLQVSGQVTAFFPNKTLLDKAINGDETSLEFTWTKGSHSLAILLPEVTFERNSPGIDGPKGIRVQLNYRAYYQDNADNAVFKATLKNGQASY